jgi:probable phosphoglycerate mutase
MGAKKTIYIIRHGQTDYNKQGIIQGSSVDSDLNDLGRMQAEQFYKAYHHIQFHNIYASALKRTQQSIHPFVKEGRTFEVMPEFNEINWGIFEGLKGTPESQKVYQAMINDWKAGLLDRAVEGGETPNEMYRRQELGLNKLMRRVHEETVLICMHGRAMRSFLCLLTQTTLKDMDNFKHNNLCMYKVQQKEGLLFDIVEQNSSQHLWI